MFSDINADIVSYSRARLPNYDSFPNVTSNRVRYPHRRPFRGVGDGGDKDTLAENLVRIVKRVNWMTSCLHTYKVVCIYYNIIFDI